MRKSGVRILGVGKNSPAEEIGLIAGDEIFSANGHEIPDELALKFYLAEDHVDLGVRRSDGTEIHFDVDLSETSDLGISIEEFRTQTCSNNCLFCFVNQLPPGVRPALTVKDDDYRLSFLHGNYITLTNLQDRDLERIIKHRLSPLYISVHATDPDLRTKILGRKKTDDLDGKIKKLINGGIRLHTQIVLMPGINDGKQLEKTVDDLYRFYPGIQSVAIVPLGLSDHGAAKDAFTPVTAAYCRKIIRRTHHLQLRFRAEIGRTFAYLADEFYMQTGDPLPEKAYYDDFEQIEDGVGMVRRFIMEFETEMKRRRRTLDNVQGTLATGKLFYPVLKSCVDRFNRKFGSLLKVCAVENRFLGKRITVAGLLAGRDISEALNGKSTGSFVIIPDEAVSRVDGLLLDGFTPGDLSRQLGKPVYAGGRTMRDFFHLLFDGLRL
jgi:putative radical SAM enzyme (TIGR03279 family)